MANRKNQKPEEPYTGPGAAAVAGVPVVPPGAPEVELADQPGDNALAQEVGVPMVQYVGDFGRREISVQDWERAGISNQPAVTWSRQNDFRVPQEAFDPKALNVLRQDPDFRFA